MSSGLRIFLTMVLLVSFSWGQNQCLSYYHKAQQIDYQQMLAAVMMNLSPEMQKEVFNQLSVMKDKDLSQQSTTKLENMFFEYFATAQKENRFDQVFNQMIQVLSSQPQFKSKLDGVPEAKKQELMEMFKMGLLGEIQLRQYFGKDFTSDIWGTIKKKIILKMDDFTQWVRLNTHQKIDKIAELTGTKATGVREVDYLIDGPESFAKRDELVEKASKSIHVLTWSVYDDATGIKFADQMIAKKQQGVDVKIIVDALTAMKSGHNQQLIRMQQNGIEVIYSRDPKLILSGQHRKVMIIDGEHAVAGGMNYGDVYSHLAGDKKWRDTDIYFTGSLAQQTQNMFVNEWNEQIRMHNLNFKLLSKVSEVKDSRETKALLLNSTPILQKNSGSPIARALLALIKGAREEIIIENAYIISNPLLEEVIGKAIKRGVKVTILTNSGESVDEPVVSNPILASALRLKKLGASIVLKKGDTLHSKVALFDNDISMIMSYNIHPRSELIEDEMAYLISDLRANTRLRKALENDIKSNYQIKEDTEIKLTEDYLSQFINRLLYNQL